MFQQSIDLLVREGFLQYQIAIRIIELHLPLGERAETKSEESSEHCIYNFLDLTITPSRNACMMMPQSLRSLLSAS
jgi:hypothetical protein